MTNKVVTMEISKKEMDVAHFAEYRLDFVVKTEVVFDLLNVST